MASKASPALSERHVREVETFCHIANENGSLISLGELLALASIDATEEELRDALLNDPRLEAKFVVEAGYVVRRTSDSGEAARQVAMEEKSKHRAIANLNTANAFGRFLASGTLLVSVGGSNSYLTAKEGEDIDFFCVTRTNGLWPFMLRGLLLARVYRFAHKQVPELCFSFEMDERWAARAFRASKEPIFARDALTAKVINGRKTYRTLLEGAGWMRNFFPVFYTMRLRETEHGGAAERREERRSGSAVLNSLLFYSLGSYLRLKSWALNRRFAKEGRRAAIFAVRMSKDFYIYESNRYLNLGRMYDELVEEAPS